jgi:hypothetical protein
MNYLHTGRVTWVVGSERLASGGDHLCTGQPHQRRRPPLHRRLASGGDHLCTDGSPAVAITSAPGSLPSGGDHLNVRAMAKRPSPPPSYGGEDKTIQAMELGARWQVVLAVWPGPHSQSLPPSQGW